MQWLGNQTSLPLQPPKLEERVPVLPPETVLQLETVLPLELIRSHTGTDDSYRITDAQLELYRQAAFEACELFTGIIVTGTRNFTEMAETPGHRRKFRTKARLTLSHPTRDGVLYFFGRDLYRPRMERVKPGSTVVTIPVYLEAIDVTPCCSPCGRGAENYGLQVMYSSGYACPSEVPAILKEGALRYIAWSIKNPGDVVMTVLNKASVRGGLIEGTNNGAFASGAADLWRMLDPSSI